MMAMGLEKLELKRESPLGQQEPKVTLAIMSAPGSIADMD